MLARRFALLAALCSACSATPASGRPDSATEAKTPAVTPEPTESADAVAPEPPRASTDEPLIPEDDVCHRFTGNVAVEQWRSQLIAAVSQRDDERTTEVVRCVDPGFDLPLFEKVEDWLVVANPRQLDDDDDEEWVLELRQYTPTQDDGARRELVWLAVLDMAEDAYELAGVVSRPDGLVCSRTFDEALAAEFPQHEPGPQARMVLVEHHASSCGTDVEVSTTRTSFRVEDGTLEKTGSETK